MVTVYETLSKIKVKTEKKGQFDYASWTTIWHEVQTHYPGSTFKVYETEAGYPAFIKKGSLGGFVKVGVTIHGDEHIENMPILDFRNQAITEEKMTAFHINTSIKRGLVKACAYHGLGLSIYHGEDFPSEDKE